MLARIISQHAIVETTQFQKTQAIPHAAIFFARASGFHEIRTTIKSGSGRGLRPKKSACRFRTLNSVLFMTDLPHVRRFGRLSKRQQTEPDDAGSRRFFWRCSIAFLIALAVTTCWFTRTFSLWPMLLANKALTNRSLDSALVWLRTAERLHGEPATIELLRARVSRRLGDMPAMETNLELALRFGAPANRVDQERMLATAQAGRLHEVEDALKRWLENPGEDGADLCDAYTNGLASQGRLTETELLLNAWESGFPLDPKPHVKRGRIAEHAREYEAAEAEYHAALKKNPDYPMALYALGRLLLDRKRAAEALPLFRQCAEASSGAAPAARVGEGSCLRSLGEVSLARQVLEAVVSLDENTLSKAYSQIGFLADGAPAALELGKLESSEQNYGAAEKWLRRAVTADPYDLDARYAWAVALRGLDRKEEAAVEFEHVSRVRKLLAETEEWQTDLAKKPDDVETRYKVAMVYLQHSSPKSGIYWLQSVLAHDPTHQPTHRALADYYETHKDEVASYASLAEHHRRMISHDSN